jgi:hypothetical protein
MIPLKPWDLDEFTPAELEALMRDYENREHG